MPKSLIPIPVFGLKEEDGHEKANSSHIAGLPSSRTCKSVEDIKNMLVNGGLETYELVQEIKRLVKIGAIPLTPKNLSLLTKAEKDCSDVLLGNTEKNSESSKNVVLQIINNLTERANEIKPITAIEVNDIQSNPVEIEDKLARFRKLKDRTIDI